jgi:alpha-tubulin suppressor-like RCC1 family protein
MPNQFLSPEGDLEEYFVDESWLIDQYVGDTLWTWGSNTSGQLGVNDTTQRNTPVTTSTGGTNWKQVASGGTSAAIKTDGTLWVWGFNSSGGLGINNTTQRNTPVTTFAGGNNWKQVSARGATAAIKTDGTLWVWGGNNTDGQLGINNTVSKSTPVTTFAGGTNWKQVACGGSHTAAIKTDGTLWTWGCVTNNNGQLGITDNNSRTTPVVISAGATNWKQVACGQQHTAAIKTDGTLWVWGSNSSGGLGINNITQVMVCTPVTTFAGGTNWKQVDTANSITAAIKTDGTLWVWGRNDFASLGINNTVSKSTPVTTFAGGTNWKQVACGNLTMAAIKTDGSLWCWGYNPSGQLGVNDTNNRTTPVTALTGGNNWKQVSCGGDNISAVTSGTDPTFFIS